MRQFPSEHAMFVVLRANDFVQNSASNGSRNRSRDSVLDLPLNEADHV